MGALSHDIAALNLNEEKKYAASLDSILEARARIQPYTHITPVMTCSSIDVDAGRSLHFKCEIFQKGGAFKFRGACNAVFSLPEDTAKQGVVTHSSGNHAAAVALAAQIRGIPAHIVVPKNAPSCKVANVERYGGKVITCEPSMESREETAKNVQHDTGAVLILPFNDERVISGQGTVAVEFLEQVPDLVITVSESEIVDAMRMCYERLKIVVEPSAVVGLAAVLSKRFQGDSQHLHCKRVGIILSGGNIDLDTLWTSIHHSIQK